ncbi:MAG: dihydrolipoamide acetyltransferase family protein [Chloroflexota bacterium]
MAIAVVMPKQGNTVENCLIAAWKKKVGEQISEGEVLCEVETDKAMMEVESPVSGTVLALFFAEGADVPVLTNIAVIGQPGEKVEDWQAAAAATPSPEPATPQGEAAAPVGPPLATPDAGSRLKISPRARNLARQKSVEAALLAGSGPGGRIIERDVQAAVARQAAMTPLARSMVAQGGFVAPAQGSGVSGRIMAADLTPATAPKAPLQILGVEEEVEVIPLKGVRKIIAVRMLESLQTTAQLTLNASADARALQAYRQQLKNSPEAFGLQKVTINDLILLAVSRTLPHYPDLNALFADDTISLYKNVQLGVAIDTPRGLMVPVIRQANRLSLKQISAESKRLAAACLEGKILPDELSGGTFTVTNLGSLGIESFTPVLNPPQVAILGVGNINLKPVEVEGEVQFIPHLSLSLTINHQVVDGAPAARFLQALAQGIAGIGLLLAL